MAPILYKWLSVTVQTHPIWTIFFLIRSEFNPESKYLVIHKIWFGFSSQIKKGEYLPQMELSEQANGIFGIP